MKRTKWRPKKGGLYLFVALAPMLLAQCGGTEWQIAGVTALDPLPKECNYVGGFGLDTVVSEPDTPPFQPAGGETFLSENSSGNTFYHAFYKCGVAEVTLEFIGGQPTTAGDPVNLRVTHFHQNWVPPLGGKDALQSLSYTKDVVSSGQTQIVFPRVVVVSTDEKTGATSGYENLETGGGVTVNFGQWPQNDQQGNALVQSGSVVPQNCIFFASSGGFQNCPP